MSHRFWRTKESRHQSQDAISEHSKSSTDARGTSPSDGSHRARPINPVSSTQKPLHQSGLVPNIKSFLRRRSRDRRADPLGLNIIYEPETPPAIDIIFVHGLGGTSQQTWSKNRDPNLFWPREWLPLESEISTARILSFGYNAHFSAAGQNVLNISDFAKELLFGMKFGVDKTSKAFEIGQVPIIFVVHSMGGLVVKKAYILGQNDVNYKDIIQSTVAIIFLSTPHRGTHLAEILNTILSVSIFNHSPKDYIAELKNNSPTLEEINEQFIEIAPTLQIVSFFETMPTAIGLRKMMVVGKDSSILGYSGEISKPLHADHHDVCKYISQQDSNYLSVRDMLRSLVIKFRRKEVLPHDTEAPEDTQNVERLLSISEAPDDDFDFFAERWLPGSCEWILTDTRFQSWSEDRSPSPRILVYHALPGSGKSVLSSFIIRHLKQREFSCQFYFFRFGDQRKTSLNEFLKSLAYQTAREVPEYRQIIMKLSEDGLNLEKAEIRLVWQKLFESALFKLSLSRPLFWVIDAIDESDSPKSLLNLFSTIAESGLPIRILFISRPYQSILLAFERLAATLSIEYTSTDESVKDLRQYVTKKMEYVHGSREFKKYVINKILNVAGGNFLWVHLVLKEILQCHTEAAIEQALIELPPELEPLYQRMEAALTRNSRSADHELAKIILTWVACSRRSLTLAELSQALLPEFPSILDLQRTINQVCGEFVLIDSKSNVTMIHQTARDYLIATPGLRYSIIPREAHHLLFERSLSFLLDGHLRARVDQVPSKPFLIYAATSWSYHLSLSLSFRDRSSILTLAKFFQGSSVLTWIHILALANQLEVLIMASKTLDSFLEGGEHFDSKQSPITNCVQEKETIEFWAIDLIKIAVKFGTHLIRHPKSIYKLVPPFCPRNSIIHRQFAPKNKNSAFCVTGFSNPGWDDHLAQFPVGRDCQGLKITCLDQYFAILISDGTVVLYHLMTCEEARRFPHGERVLTMRFSSRGDKLVTYGFRTTKVWSVDSALQLRSIMNSADTKALEISFGANDQTLLTCSDDRVIRQLSLPVPDEGWNAILVDQEFVSDYYSSPNCVAFNPDGTQIAMAYRGFPLSVWRVDFPGLIGRCERPGNTGHTLWTGVDRVGWNPITGHVFGIYSDGCSFKWHPLESENQELQTVSLEVQCSPDGNLLVTSGSDGTLRIWNFHHFTLIYQLSCTTPVTDLAIDPGGRRIYDLRESYCNVWEPNALIRLSQVEEMASKSSKAIGPSAQLVLASETSVEMRQPITALAISPRTSTCCAGSDEGILTLLKKGANEAVELSQSLMAIDHIVWSEDEQTLATGDLSGSVTITSIDLTTSKAPEQTILRTTTDEGIQQLLLSHSSKILLVSTLHFANVWSLDTKSLIVSRKLPKSSRRWSLHPHDVDLLFCISFASVEVWKWGDFTMLKTIQIDRTKIDTENTEQASEISSGEYFATLFGFEDSVDGTLFSPDASLMIVETSRPSHHRRRRKQFMIIKTSDIGTGPWSAEPSDPIVASPLPEEVLNRIELPLGFLTNDLVQSLWSLSPRVTDGFTASYAGSAVLAFLDKDFWVCTGDLTGGDGRSGAKDEGRVMRYFFLPRDWLNMECLELAVMTKEGTLLCPRNGEVAVVTGGLRDEWVGQL